MRLSASAVALAAALLSASGAAAGEGRLLLGGRSVRVGHWNVYWKALDDPAGRHAIKASIDGAIHDGGPFDFFALLEASGSSHAAAFPEWVQTSEAFRDGGLMKYIHGKSFRETIALFYRHEQWEPVWSDVSSFQPGRPFITGLFKLRNAPSRGDSEFFSCADSVWVVGAHLPHYSSKYEGHTPKIGERVNAVLSRGAAITGCDPTVLPTIIVGDFNEFGECSVPPNVHCSVEGFRHAARSMAPLWDYLGHNNVADAADSSYPTCCTKWHENVKNDWWHHYDHMYYTKSFLNMSKSAQFIPYMYPGVASCRSPSCTGPLTGAAPRSRGSWHRGWQATFEPRRIPEEAFVV